MKSLLIMLGMVFALVSCAEDKGTSSGGSSGNKAIVEAQIKKDFDGAITDLTVTTKRGYEVATFKVTNTRGISTDTRATDAEKWTAWYKIANAKATKKQSAKYLGTTIPAELPTLDTAFKATPKYSDSKLWEVTGVEIDIQGKDANETRVYEVELVNLKNRKLEAELYYSFDNPIKLLYSKETLDADDEEDKVVIDEALTAAVKTVYPTPATIQIIDAEMEDNNVEVEVLVTTNSVTTENEVEFTVSGTTYTVVSQESEAKLTYNTIAPTEVKTAVTTWFTTNVGKVAEAPTATDTAFVTTITTGTGAAAVVTYEVDMEYTNSTDNKFYDVELELSAAFVVTGAEAEIDGTDVVFP